MSVVRFHVDGLSRISDEFGHPAADETARAVADVLLKHTGDINVLFRYDSELFAVLLVETPLKGARLYIDRLRYVLSRSTFKHSDRVTAHFGRAGLPDCKAAVGEDLVRQAEESLRATRGEPEPKRAKPTGLDNRQLNLGGW